MLTGQMRSFEKCFQSTLQNIIGVNKDHEFDIYILTEYLGKSSGNNDGTSKNFFHNPAIDVYEFRKQIERVYGNYLKLLIIEENRKSYPSFLKDYGPWLCLYKNKKLFDSIKDEYDIFIRMRPDIVLSDNIIIDKNTVNKDEILIFCGKFTRRSSWLHNRDWDHMCVSNKYGMELWCDYFSFLKYNPPFEFEDEIRFNNVGYWVHYEKKDKSVIATQLLLKHVHNNNFRLIFDAHNVYTLPVRN